MSLEKAIEANTAAVEENTAMLKAVLEQQKKALTALSDRTEDEPPKSRKGAVEDDEDEKPRSRRAAKDDDDEDEKPRSRRAAKDEDDEDEKPRTRRAASADKKAEKPEKGGKSKGVSDDDLRAKFGEFWDVDDEDLEEKRREFVQDMLEHLGVERTTQIKAEDREQVIEWLDAKAAGKKVKFD